MSTIYFAGALDKVKIGCSNRPAARILQVGEWVPFPITMLATMPGTLALESALHRMFTEEWSHGEWFHLSPRLRQFIERVAKGLPVEIVDRDLTEADNLRRQAIAHKKRLARKRHILPVSIVEQLERVPVGMAIPEDLLNAAYSALQAA